MLTVETIEQFKDAGFGWISPLGEIAVCSLFEHFTVLYQFADISQYVQNFDNICRDNFDQMTSSLEALEPGEHPEMHRFDGMDDSARFDLMKALYENGYKRLGTSRDRYGEIRVCTVEGYDNFTKKQKQVISDLGMMIGKDIKYEIVKLVIDGRYEYFQHTSTE